jgi:hypothetical protein
VNGMARLKTPAMPLLDQSPISLQLPVLILQSPIKAILRLLGSTPQIDNLLILLRVATAMNTTGDLELLLNHGRRKTSASPYRRTK